MHRLLFLLFALAFMGPVAAQSFVLGPSGNIYRASANSLNPAVSITDLNGSGLMDIVLWDYPQNSSGYFTPSTRVYLDVSTAAGGAFGLPVGTPLIAPTPLAPGNITFPPVARDVNGDGNVDFLAASINPLFPVTTQVDVVPGLGGVTLGTPFQAISTTGWLRSAMKLGDFDGDGLQDAVFSKSLAPIFVSGPVQVEVWLQRPTTWLLAHSEPFPMEVDLSVGDFDQNGATDVAIWNQLGLNLLRGSLTSTFVPSIPINAGPTPGFFLESQRVDGDAFPDLVQISQALIGVSQISVLHGHPTLGLVLGTWAGAFRPFVSTVSYGRYFQADFDADGATDIAYLSQPGGVPSQAFRIDIFRNRTDGSFSSERSMLTSTLNPGEVFIEDFDADGDPDILNLSFPNERLMQFRHWDNLALFGSGCQGSLGIPSLTHTPAFLGNAAFSATLTNVPASTPCALLLSRQRFVATGCGLLVSLLPSDLLLPFGSLGLAVSNASNVATINVPLPPLPSLAGLYFLQGAALDAGGLLGVPPLNFSMSRGKALLIY